MNELITVGCSSYFRLVVVVCCFLLSSMTLKVTGTDSTGSISVAMLGDLSPPKVLNRGYIYAQRHSVNFLNNVFGTFGQKGIAEKKVWPPIHTENCPGMTSHFDRDIPYQRGCILAHKQIWEEFVVKHKNVPATISVYESPKVRYSHFLLCQITLLFMDVSSPFHLCSLILLLCCITSVFLSVDCYF